MKSINIENLMNHSIGVSNSYYRPQEKELLDDYLQAVEHLTIKENNNNNEIEKGAVEGRIKAIEEKHSKEINDLRENMESKFEQIFLKVSVDKLIKKT